MDNIQKYVQRLNDSVLEVYARCFSLVTVNVEGVKFPLEEQTPVSNLSAFTVWRFYVRGGIPYVEHGEVFSSRGKMYQCEWTKELKDCTPSVQAWAVSSKDRWKERSRTYTGIAVAMATQWSYDV